MKKEKTKQKTQSTVDREAVRVLAIELGAREVARRLGIKESTVLSWARRYNWKLPKRKGGAISAITMQSRPGDALIAHHKELEEGTKTSLMQTLHKASQAVAQKDPLDITNMAQFRDACLSAARMFGWDGSAHPSVTVNADKAVVVCDEKTRQELRAQRKRLLALDADVKRVEVAATVTLPAQETQSNATAGAGNSIVAQNQSPVAQQDPVSQRWESISKAESWKTGKGSEPENEHAGSWGKWPEEYE